MNVAFYNFFLYETGISMVKLLEDIKIYSNDVISCKE